jgi:hypothetical protein
VIVESTEKEWYAADTGAEDTHMAAINAMVAKMPATLNTLIFINSSIKTDLLTGCRKKTILRMKAPNLTLQASVYMPLSLSWLLQKPAPLFATSQ